MILIQFSVPVIMCDSVCLCTPNDYVYFYLDPMIGGNKRYNDFLHFPVLGVSPGEGTGATMSDDDEDQIDSDANLFDGSFEGHDAMGFGPLIPTDSERSLMERVRHELKHELKNVRPLSLTFLFVNLHGCFILVRKLSNCLSSSFILY